MAVKVGVLLKGLNGLNLIMCRIKDTVCHKVTNKS